MPDYAYEQQELHARAHVFCLNEIKKRSLQLRANEFNTYAGRFVGSHASNATGAHSKTAKLQACKEQQYFVVYKQDMPQEEPVAKDATQSTSILNPWRLFSAPQPATVYQSSQFAANPHSKIYSLKDFKTTQMYKKTCGYFNRGVFDSGEMQPITELMVSFGHRVNDLIEAKAVYDETKKLPDHSPRP